MTSAGVTFNSWAAHVWMGVWSQVSCESREGEMCQGNRGVKAKQEVRKMNSSTLSLGSKDIPVAVSRPSFSVTWGPTGAVMTSY